MENLSNSLTDEETTSDFETVWLTAAKVSNGMINLPTDRKGMLASQLLSQSTVTATTISSLIRPIRRTGIPSFPPSFTIVDLPSLAILTRAIVETYLVHFYLAVESVSSQESEFRLLWWDWHEINERLWSLERIGSQHPKVNSFKKKRDELRKAVSGHTSFASLPNKLRDEFGRNWSPSDALLKSKAKIAEAAGIHTDQFRLVYKSLSQYAHAQPVAVSTMLGLAADHPDIGVHFGMCARYATSYLLFTIRDFIKVFPDASKFTDDRFTHLDRLWSDIHQTNLKTV